MNGFGGGPTLDGLYIWMNIIFGIWMNIIRRFVHRVLPIFYLSDTGYQKVPHVGLGLVSKSLTLFRLRCMNSQLSRLGGV